MPSLSAVSILRRLLHRDGLLRAASAVHSFRLVAFCHNHYSTAPAEAAAADETHFLARFLVSSSLGFSRDEAAAAARKLNRVRTKKALDNPNLVVNFFQECGLEQTQIKKIAATYPHWLLADVEHNLRPKTRVLLDLGISGFQLFRILSQTAFYNMSLDSRIIPVIDFLKSNLGSEGALKAIMRTGRIMSVTLKKLASNMAFLQNSGFPHERIQKCVCIEPGVLGRNLDVLQEAVHTIEKDLGIPRTSPMFLLVALPFLRLSKSTMERKLKILRSFGLSDSDIKVLIQRQPSALMSSETRMKERLDFYINNLGFQPTYVALRPSLLCYSFERRILPRSEVFKVLKEKVLNKFPAERHFYSMMALNESRFLERYVLPYKDELPDMHKQYIASMRI